MSVRILLIPRTYVYLVVAILCLAGGLSIAALWRRSASMGDFDFGGRVVVTTSSVISQSEETKTAPVLADRPVAGVDLPVAEVSPATTDISANLAHMDSKIEEALASARAEYDYDGSSLATARLSRDYARSREIDLLREAIDESGARGESAEDTQRLLMSLVSRIEAESSAESLIRASGFADAVVFVTDLGVEAVVSSDKLDKSDVAVIGGILSRTTGAKLHEIRIREAVQAPKKDNPAVW
jgi:hypothetical protein